MDRVTKSFLDEFKNSFGFESIENEPVLFEHFANYTIVEPKTEFRFEIEKLNIGIDNTIGIDGFALIINKQFIDSIDELEDYLSQNKRSSAEIVFIQSKTSPKFDSKEIGNFGFAVNDFIAEKQTLKWSGNAIDKIKLFNCFVTKISELKEKPVCSLYYITLGINENDQNVLAKVSDTKNDIEQENIFSKINFELIGAADLQNSYKNIGQAIEKSFEFQARVTLPLINNVKEAYLGIVSAKTIISLMTDETGSILSNVFYDNVRDYQGDNKVNIEIANTLKSLDKDSFSIMNNGITIVADELITTRDTFKITNYQIINGCQTSHVLFENKDVIDDTVKVSIKLIITDNDDLTSRVIRSTNRQTAVKEQDLIAFSNFQKRLEDYYKTFTGNDKLYYERRSKQYNNKLVERKRIIDKTTQIKAVASLYYDKPDLATRYFGTLFNELGNILFKDNHEMFPYYVASYGIYIIDSLFRNNKIDRKFKKIKYHLLTMIRHEVCPSKCSPFESKKVNEYSDRLLNVFKNEAQLLEMVALVLLKIDSLGFDLNNNEISKSKEFVKKCLDKYHQ